MRTFLTNILLSTANLGHYQGDSFTNLMLIEGHLEPQNEVGSLNLAEHLIRFELGTFQF